MKTIIFRILTIGWTSAILFFTLTPDIDGEIFWLLEIEGLDKLAHFGLFFLLSLLSYHAFKSSYYHYKYSILIATIYGLLFSTLTEYGQIYVEGRTSDLFDFLTNMIGVSVGIIVSDRFFTKEN